MPTDFGGCPVPLAFLPHLGDFCHCLSISSPPRQRRWGGGGWRKDNFPDSQRNSLAIIRTNLENRSNGDFSSFLLLVSSLDHLSDSFLPRHVEGFEPSARDYCNGVLCNRCTRPVRRLCTISQATLLNGPSSLLFAAITFALAYLYNCLHSVTYLHSLYTFNRA